MIRDLPEKRGEAIGIHWKGIGEKAVRMAAVAGTKRRAKILFVIVVCMRLFRIQLHIRYLVRLSTDRPIGARRHGTKEDQKGQDVGEELHDACEFRGKMVGRQESKDKGSRAKTLKPDSGTWNMGSGTSMLIFWRSVNPA